MKATAYLNVKRRSWFEGPDSPSDDFHLDLIRYDSGDRCGVLSLSENPVVEPGFDPQSLSRHFSKHLFYLCETPGDGDLMSHLINESDSIETSQFNKTR